MGVFSLKLMYFSIGLHRLLKQISRLITCYQDCDRSLMFVFHCGKSITVFGLHGFFFFYHFSLVGALAVVRMTVVKDIHLTLTAISFQVKVNNSSIFLPLQTYEKTIAEFPFLLSL